MRVVTIKNTISLEQLQRMAKGRFGDMVKAVVDIKKEIIVVDAELHADQEAFLIKSGSQQADLWGINIYPDLSRDERIEFDSMINGRPSQDNMSRVVEDVKTGN